jgi:hypothetical protein
VSKPNPNPHPTSPFAASTVEERIDAAQAEAQKSPDAWHLVDAPVSYNRYTRLLNQNSVFDYKFDVYDDELTTPNGNSSGSRLGSVVVFFSTERNPDFVPPEPEPEPKPVYEQPTLQPSDGEPIDWSKY